MNNMINIPSLVAWPWVVTSPYLWITIEPFDREIYRRAVGITSHTLTEIII